MSERIHTLFCAGHGRGDGERATIPFVLANIEVEDKAKRVEVALMFDAVHWALAGKADGFHIGVPFETHDLGTRMRLFMEAGGIINVCTPCLIHRKLEDAALMPGIVKINGRVLMEKKDRADKLLMFV